MASERGRGAQVRLDEAARQIARGGAGLLLLDALKAKDALERSGTVPTGLTPDGSLGDGTAADDEVLLPGGLPTGLGGSGVGFTSGAVVNINGFLFVQPPGPYADDTAAAVGGVPVNAAYRHPSGAVLWRMV